MNVRPHHIRAALRGFLELLESTDAPASLGLLELWLGQLAFLQHFVDKFTASDGVTPHPPIATDARWHRLVTEQFPALGTEPAETLAAIASELDECLRRWESDGQAQGLWYLHASYQAHWGKRLRVLQSWVHEIG